MKQPLWKEARCAGTGRACGAIECSCGRTRPRSSPAGMRLHFPSPPFRLRSFAFPLRRRKRAARNCVTGAMGSFLDKPKKNKDTHRDEGLGLRVGLSAMQGWRVDMEVRLARRGQREGGRGSPTGKQRTAWA